MLSNLGKRRKIIIQLTDKCEGCIYGYNYFSKAVQVTSLNCLRFLNHVVKVFCSQVNTPADNVSSLFF